MSEMTGAIFNCNFIGLSPIHRVQLHLLQQIQLFAMNIISLFGFVKLDHRLIEGARTYSLFDLLLQANRNRWTKFPQI